MFSKYFRYLLKQQYSIRLQKEEAGSSSQRGFDFKKESINPVTIDIDRINSTLARCCKKLTHLGIFYRQSELMFERDPQIEHKNKYLIELLQSCVNMKQISYLKSFKVQDEEDEGVQDSAGTTGSPPSCKRFHADPSLRRGGGAAGAGTKSASYFHFIRYAIQHASKSSCHVNMQPCYGYDISPSSGCHLNADCTEFLETTLPVIRPPRNDFHSSFLV